MKEYKYKINGNLYKVSVGEIEKNIAHVEVNGTVYNVEMEEAAPVKVSAPKPSYGYGRTCYFQTHVCKFWCRCCKIAAARCCQ